MNNILLFVAVAIAFVSVNSAPAVSTPPTFQVFVGQVCLAVTTPQVQAQAQVIYNKVVAAINANSNALLPLSGTVAYITNVNNENAFLAGGSTCTQFFTGLLQAVQGDLTANGVSAQLLEQKAAQYIQTIVANAQANAQATG